MSAREGAAPPLVPAEVLRQVRRIELRTRRLVNARFAGEYRSIFKGQGMEFAEVREYQPGDEVRAIDWHVTARMRRPFVKRYIEERELTLMLVVDQSGSSRFGTGARAKAELAAELAAVLTMAAVRNNDRVGALLYTDRVELVVPPSKGRRHALRIVRDVLARAPRGRGTDTARALDYLRRILAQRAVVVLISDLLDPGLEAPLRRLVPRHDVVVATLDDPRERALPDVGVARFVDPETGAQLLVDTGDPAVRAAFDARVLAERATRRDLLRRLGIDELPVGTDTGYLEALLRFCRARERRAARR